MFSTARKNETINARKKFQNSEIPHGDLQAHACWQLLDIIE